MSQAIYKKIPSLARFSTILNAFFGNRWGLQQCHELLSIGIHGQRDL